MSGGALRDQAVRDPGRRPDPPSANDNMKPTNKHIIIQLITIYFTIIRRSMPPEALRSAGARFGLCGRTPSGSAAGCPGVQY